MNFFRKLFFQIWYFRDPPWDTNQTPPEVLEFIGGKQPGKALDLGCGTGTNVITLAQNNWQAIGVDFIPKAIRIARRKAKRAGVQAKFYIGDVTKLDEIQGQFDLVLDIGCYHSLDKVSMAAYRDRLAQLLSPGGYYLIYFFFRKGGSLSGSGATEEDLLPFSDYLELIKREDGTERGIRKSSWLTYRKSNNGK